jgi:hypothetical protein
VFSGGGSDEGQRLLTFGTDSSGVGREHPAAGRTGAIKVIVVVKQEASYLDCDVDVTLLSISRIILILIRHR